MNSLSRWLLGLRDGGFLLGLALLLFFPAGPAVWDFVQLFSPQGLEGEPLLGAFLRFWDPGGQRPMSRALLRLLISGLIVVVLAMPSQGLTQAQKWWRYLLLALGLGLVSSLLAPHRFMAVSEWETWGAVLGLAWTVGLTWKRSFRLPVLVLCYLLVGLLVLHSVWVSLPSSPGRLGGLFHHPNALSTFCLILAPLFCWRSTGESPDRLLAQMALGVCLGLVLLSGSLTGALIVSAASCFWAAQGCPVWVRGVVAGAAAVLIVGFNLLGGWIAVVGFPSLLLAVSAVIMLRGHLAFSAKAGAAVLGTCALLMLVSLALAPSQGVKSVGNSNRARSGGARISFYGAAANMALQHPVWGVGPGGFSRAYPRSQDTVAYFSKFPHCLPLEILCEWGVPAFLLLTLALLHFFQHHLKTEPSQLQRVCVWSLLLLFAHCLTGVQSQFPYLFCLAAVVFGVYCGEIEADRGTMSVPLQATRIVVALGFVLGLAWNGTRVAAEFDLSLAQELAPRAGPHQLVAVSGLARSAQFLAPLSSETARQWGSLLLHRGDLVGARDLGRLAVELDAERASCHHLWLKAGERPSEAVEVARGLDPVNFPDFHRWRAELYLKAGEESAALELLRAEVPKYDLDKLAALPDFRRNDLAEQLVELFALKSILEEQVGGETAERDLRLALHFTENQERRLRRLVGYPDGVELELSPHFEELFDQLAQQLPR